MTRSEKTRADITALLRSRHTLLWVVTREEHRVENAIVEAAASVKYETRLWDCATGLSKPDGERVDPNPDPQGVIQRIRDDKSRTVYVLRDWHKWLTDPFVLRGTRSLARSLERAQCTIVVLTPVSDVPVELSGHATVIDYPIPERSEIAKILDDINAKLPEPLTNGERDAAIDAAIGLTAQEAGNCYAKSAVLLKRIDARTVASEKKQVIAREKVLTWHDPDPRGLDGVGGLDLLKAWLTQRKLAFSAKAREYGLSAPKGVLICGIPGTGKSLTAKCIASAWGMPLLRLDMGALQSKWVGESQANIRKALQVAETVSPCILWLDEIEKALAGATQGAADGGVSADALGAVLSWMQERTGSVFVVATANDVSSLPPELLRKGRFDEVWWVDLPTSEERSQILRATLAQHGRSLDVEPAIGATSGFTGAELAAIVPDALFAAFADGERQVTTQDLLFAASNVVPLAKTAAEKISRLREWAKGRARPASRPEVDATVGEGRKLDL